jgi:hypothetical protein
MGSHTIIIQVLLIRLSYFLISQVDIEELEVMIISGLDSLGRFMTILKKSD